MYSRRLVFFLLAAFLVGNLVLIFIKYTSDNNTDSLLAGNKRQLHELAINNELKSLESNVWKAEALMVNVLLHETKADKIRLRKESEQIKANLVYLAGMPKDDSTARLFNRLQVLVQQKLAQIETALSAEKIEAFLATDFLTQNRPVAEEIVLRSEQISDARQDELAAAAAAVDRTVKRIERLDTFLIISVLICAAALFWYIVNIIRVQNRLLQRVKLSEQKARKAAQVKENFLANMSHEIRTPLNAIIGFTQLLQQKNLDEETARQVEIIHRSGENLLTLINDILDLSKIEAGMMRIESMPFSLREVLHAIESMFYTKASAKGLYMETHIADQVPDDLVGDPTRLTQILVNLVSNAVKFTEQGGVRVIVAMSALTAEHVRINIQVRDTGIGIDSQQLPHIFERFQQADDAVTRRFGGTGLGLSIVAQLVELQGGDIKVESQPGGGTRFTILLRYGLSSVATNSSKPNTAIQYGRTLPGAALKVLLVEDNEVNQTLVQQLFRKQALNITIASNGQEAIEQMRLIDFDVLLMDIQMPVMDGYTATKYIRQKLGSNVPIIALTAHAMPGEREKCISAGMNDYLSKPVREKELWAVLQQWLPDRKSATNAVKNAPETQSYRYIDLSYMKEVASGDVDYEKIVTTQFIAAVPKALLNLRTAAEWGNKKEMQQEAHNLKTTISVMGLNEQLQSPLDALELGTASNDEMVKHIETVTLVCDAAVEEAKAYFRSLK